MDEKFTLEFGLALRSQGLRLEADPHNGFKIWVLWVFKAWPRAAEGADDSEGDAFSEQNAWKLELLPSLLAGERWKITLRFALPFSHHAHWMLRQNAFLDPSVSSELFAMEGSVARFADELCFNLEMLTALLRHDGDDSVVHWNDPGPVPRLALAGGLQQDGRLRESWVGKKRYGEGAFERIWWAYHGYCSVRSVLLLLPDGRLCGYFAVEGGNAVLLGTFSSRPQRLSSLAVLAWAAVRERLWVRAPRGYGPLGLLPACDPDGAAYGGVEAQYRRQVRSYRLEFTHCGVYVPGAEGMEGRQSRWVACSEAGEMWPLPREARVKRRQFGSPTLPVFTGSRFIWGDRYYEGHVPQYGN